MAAMYLNALSETVQLFARHTAAAICPTDIHRHSALRHEGREDLRLHRETERTDRAFEAPFEGIVNNLERRFRETQSSWIKEEIEALHERHPVRRVPRANDSPP